MAKSSRSSARKANAHRRATNINGPVEQARAERLSAKLLEIAQQPKPETSDVNMDAINEDAEEDKDKPDAEETTMEIDGTSSKPRPDRKRITKRKVKKSSIVFKKARDKSNKKKTQGKSSK